MVTQRRPRILSDQSDQAPSMRLPPATATPPALREEQRPSERDGFTLVYGRASGWYYRRERGR